MTITSVSGQTVREGPPNPIVLKLQDGLQQLVPARSANAAAPSSARSWFGFASSRPRLANPDEDFRPRGEDEREMTLLELWAASRNPPAHIEPWEISAELNGRLVRILTLPLLPLMAIPLAIDRVRGQRSYGLVVGLAMLIAFHQLLQVGEALADNNKIPDLGWAVAAFRPVRRHLGVDVRARRDACS